MKRLAVRHFLACLSSAVWIAIVIGMTAQSDAQMQPDVPAVYKTMFFRYTHGKSFIERQLNKIGQTGHPIGRSFALIAGVTQYPNLGPANKYLRPADVDIENLKSYLQNVEDFDEIVVLKDKDVTPANLTFFLSTYFPQQLAASPHSRFLLAYSGHGFAENQSDSATGYLLTTNANSFTDSSTSISMQQLRNALQRDIDNAEKVLVLINACQSGAFLNKKFLGGGPLDLGSPGAHAILASRRDQKSLQMNEVGPGSVFFETVFRGLRGDADINPRDGVVTYHELDNYLRRQIPLLTQNTQIPMEGDLARAASVGEFFFLSRDAQVFLAKATPWHPIDGTRFGEPQVDDPIENALRAETWKGTIKLLVDASATGNKEAKRYLAGLVQMQLPAAHTEIRSTYRSQQRLWQTWFEDVANQGDVVGMEALAVMYEEGTVGTGAKDPQAANTWRVKAASRGNTISMTRLGDSLSDGTIRSEQLSAMRWFHQCADLEIPECMVKLGDFYEEGEWVNRSFLTARQWYEKAAASTDEDDEVDAVEAMEKLAKYYQNGLGVRQNEYMAEAWTRKAKVIRQKWADAAVQRQLNHH